ncbi:MAG: GreA/GreB family elongation factor, partial [Planctomycetota bacterium]
MKDILKAARKGRTDEVEEIWMDILGEKNIPWQDLVEAGRALCRVDERETAESLFWMLVSTLQERGQQDNALIVARAGLKSVGDSEDLRKETIELYEQVHDDGEWARAVLKLSLEDETLSGDQAIEKMEKLGTMAPGKYVRVDPGARIGKILSLHPRRGFEVDFDGRRGTFGLDQMDRLQSVADDDIRALMVYERERLEKMAENAPLDLIKLVLTSFGDRMNLKRLRRYIKPVLGDLTWSQWWSRTRKQLDKSSTIGSTGGRSPDLFVRSEPVDRAEQLKRRFDHAQSFDKVKEVDKILGEIPDDQKRRTDLLEHIIESLRESCENARQEGNVALQLASLAALEKVQSSDAGVASDNTEAAREVVEAERAEQTLRDDVLPEDILTGVLEKCSEWYEQSWGEMCGRVMPHLPTVGCSWCANWLSGMGHSEQLQQVAQSILHMPDPHPGAIIWLWKVANRDGPIAGADDIHRLSILRKMLSVLALASRGGAMSESEQRKLTSRVRDALLAAGEDAIEETVSHASDEEISALMAQVERNQGLTQRVRARVARSIRAARPELFRSTVPPWQQKVIYTTEEGHKKRRDEYDYIVNERMPEVIKELGEAAEFGDLSENAEYTTALEERGRLSEEAGKIKDELSRSRIITHEMADSSTVTVGSHVTVQDADNGKERTLIFLGPWDAEPQNDIYSYQAPLSLKFMGKAVGDTVKARKSGEVRT